MQRLRMAVVPEGGRTAVTHFRVFERLGEYTWVDAGLETGGTHQICVRLAVITHPVAGDPLTFQAPLPEEIRVALRRLGAGEELDSH